MSEIHTPLHTLHYFIVLYINLFQLELNFKCTAAILLGGTRKPMQGIKKYRRQKANQLPATAYRNFEHNFVFGFKDMPQVFDEEFPPKKN